MNVALLFVLAGSFFTLFVGRDATELSRGLLRVLLSVVLLISVFFQNDYVLELGGLVFSASLLFIIWISRSDLQVNDGN